MSKIKKNKSKNFAIEDINITNDNGGENEEKHEPVIEEVAPSVENVAAPTPEVAAPINEEQILPDIEEINAEKPKTTNKVKCDNCSLYITKKHLNGNHKHFCKGLKNTDKNPPELPPPPKLERQISFNNHRVLTLDTPPGLPVKGRYDNIIKNMF